MEHPRPYCDEEAGPLGAREGRDRRGPRFVLGVIVRGREEARETHLGGCFDEARDVWKRRAAFGRGADEFAVGGQLAEPEKVELFVHVSPRGCEGGTITQK